MVLYSRMVDPSLLAARRANSDTPCGKLPEELVLRIFEECELFHVDQRRKSYQWLRILHVCHRWYSVGLHCPMLWTTVHIGQDVECARALLDRSQGLPLDVHIGRVYDRHIRVLSVLLSEMPRIKSLHLEISHHWYTALANGSFPWKTIAPTAMKELSLSVTRYIRHDAIAGQVTLHKLFPHGFPALQDLKVTCDVNIDCTINATNLRNLSLEIGNFSNRDRGTAELDMPSLFKSLRTMSFLRHILLAGNLGQLPDVSYALQKARPGASLSLPSLRSLALKSSSGAIANFLTLVSTPVDCSLKLATHADTPTGLLDLAPSIRNTLRNGLPNGRLSRRDPLRRLTIRGAATDWNFTLESCSCRHGHDHTDCSSPQVNLFVSYCQFPTPLLQLLTSLPFADVETLVCAGNGRPPSLLVPLTEQEAVIGALSSLNRVRTLERVVPSCLEIPGELEQLRAIWPNLEKTRVRVLAPS